MRIVGLKNVFLCLVLVGAGSPVSACGLDGLLEPAEITFPGLARSAVLRGDHLLCTNDSNHIIAVDLKAAKSFDLGPGEGKRWIFGDIAGGQALLLTNDRLLVVALDGGTTVRQVEVDGNAVCAFGFAGKDRAFLHLGTKVAVVELTTGKTLHTVELAREGRGATGWQKVEDRLYVVGPANMLCVIDLDKGKLLDQFKVEARGDIRALQVEGELVYCLGQQFGYGFMTDHVTYFSLKTKKTTETKLTRTARDGSRLAAGPFGTAYLFDGNQVERFDMSGRRIATFAPESGAAVLAIWHGRAVVAEKDKLRLLEIKETPVVNR